MKKYLKLLFVWSLFFVFSSTTTASALDTTQRAVISSGIGYFNVEENPACIASLQSGSVLAPLPQGSGIYMLGDSLTVGMRDAGQITEKFTSRGWITSQINAVGGEDLAWGLEQVQVDMESIRTSTAAVIGLGTNNVGTVVNGDVIIEGGKEQVKSQIQSIVTSVKTTNPDIRMYWTSVYITGILETQFGTFNMDIARGILNEAITEVAVQNNVSVIPWATSGEAINLLSSDGIHPSGNYPEMADFIVEQLAGSSTIGSASGCVCTVSSLPGNSNTERVFNYFTGTKGLSPEIAAGIIGNMYKESPGVSEGEGPIEPQQLQGEFERKVPSSEAIGVAIPGSSLGWGIVQWTPGTKIMQTARNAGVPFEEIDTLEFQLDFLWGQLTGEAWRGNPNNESSEKSAGDIIFASTTVEEATINFGRYYERFQNSTNLNNPEYQERIDSALEVLQTISPSGATGVSCSGDRQPGANGWDLPGEGNNPMVLFSQKTSGSDPAVEGYFGSYPYGPGPISHCGCGPTSWAMIVSTLTSRQVEPPEVASWASRNGFQESGDPCGGSYWWWADNPTLSASEWGVSARTISLDQAAASLQSGALIMVSVGPGPFTGGGHLLVMRAVTDDGRYLFADPNDYDDPRPEADVFGPEGKSRTPLAAEDFASSLKGLWEIRAL